MAFESLFSRPPNSALLDTHMTECQHAGDERKEGELEDGEIEDGGFEEEPEPEEVKEEPKEEEEKPPSEKTHKKSRKRKREKKKRRRREKHKHSDNSSVYSYDSDEHSERPHKPPMYRDYDSHYSQRGHGPGSYIGPHKKSTPSYDDYSNYSDGNYNEEDEEDYAEQLKHYRQAKESPNMGEPPYKKMGMKGGELGEQQQKGYYYSRGGGPHKKMMMRKDRGRGRGGHKGSYYQDSYQESPGCDGILGSNSTLDTCGVCGGDGSTCKFITGTFKDTNVPIGYHKILEIPKGATQISIRELTWSPNYLALRNRAGKSIVNGNWAVDPPGKYEAGGTAFIYNQPSRDEQEGESFTAPGPTSEALDVYMIFQQDNPGVSFQYFIASPPSSDIPGHVPNIPQQEHAGPQRSVPSIDSVPQTNPRGHPVERHLVPPPQARPPPPPRPAGTLQRNVRIPPLPAPPTHYWPEQPQFFWRRVGNTPCSVTCGKGFWYPVYQCVSRSSLDEVSEEECDLSNKPFPQEEACNTQPCPAFWDVGNWSVCSRTCGPGIQHRQVLCRQMYANRTTMVHPQRCGHLPKPNVTQTCQLRICSQWEIQSNWSTCSVMCGVGQRTRHVRCISSQGDEVGDGECSNRLRPRTNEACDMGPCVRSWFHNEWSSTCSSECGMGIQRRSVFCLSSSASDESQDGCGGTKPSDMRVCNSGPCERIVKWYTGPWSECSADCDEGSQRRDVICISKLGTEFNVTDPSECAHLDKPTGLQSCNAGPCGSRWFTSPWSTCSQSCLGGLQVREVRCLTADKSFSQLCDLDSKPDEKKTCNTQPCSAVLDENCRDRYHNCAVVVQARLCVYAYYKQACCSSCSHSLQRTRASENR